MAGLDNRISNIIGSRIPDWVMHQLTMRSIENSLRNRNSENITYIANKTAWVRLVSSVNIKPDSEISRLFNQKVDDQLAKENILFGGLSTFSSSSYSFREGFEQTYNLNGNESIQNYGYRPMPGITSVKVETQGKLGSVRSATIEFKVWTKDQLDVMDALYFKLGFSMFLEWGHVKYYKTGEYGNKPLDSYTPKREGNSESYQINPFDPNEDKDSIRVKIANNVRDSDGNYDAMLGIVTNFNFSMNSAGGYDCTLKLMSLGILADSMRVNSIGSSPKVLEEDIKRLVDRINDQNEERVKREKAIEDATNPDLYPVCIKKLKPGEATDKVPIEIKGNKSFGTSAYLATVNSVQYYFYKDGRYQTTGLSKSGTYECKGDVLYIDGKSIDEKRTYQEWIDYYKNKGYVESKILPSMKDQKVNYDVALSSGASYYYGITKFKALINKKDEGQVKLKLNLNSIVGKPKPTPTKANYNGTPTSTQSVIDALSAASSVDGGLIGLAPITQKYGNLPNYLLTIDEPGIQIGATDRSDDGQIFTFTSGDYYTVYIDKSETVARDLPDWAHILATTSVVGLAAGGADNLVMVYDFFSGDSDFREAKFRYNAYNEKNEVISHELDLLVKTRGGLTLKKDEQTYISEEADGSYYPLYEDDSTKKPISAKLKQEIAQVLNNPNTQYTLGDIRAGALNEKPKLILSTNLVTKRSIKVTKVPRAGVSGKESGTPITIFEDVEVSFPIFIKITDSSLITDIIAPKSITKNTIDYAGNQQAIKDQDQKETTEDTVDPNNLAADLILAEVIEENSQKYKSNIECILRAIQVHSLIKYTGDNSIVRVNYVETLKDYDNKQNISQQAVNKKDSDFMRSLLSSGLITYELIQQAMSSNEEVKLDEEIKANNYSYDKTMPYYIKYGFNHAALANKTGFSDLAMQKAAVDYPNLVTSYVIPYKQNQDLFQGANLNFPVYIPMGFFVMLLNHCGLLYEYDNAKNPKPKKKPLVYVDYNQHTNRCLTNDSMFSTNPYRFVIPFEGNQEAYKKLFANEVLDEKSSEILGGQGFPNAKLFNFAEEDRLSNWIPRFRYKTGNKREAYSGRIMDVLLSIDYVLQIISAHTTRDETNSIYLKPMLEELISDMNKCFGNFNLFRLAYNDTGDCYYISDDQLSPSLAGEDQVVADNPNEIPLFGLRSIAQSLEIRTEISTKLANMLAISANADVGSRSSSGLDGGSFSFGQYIDRFKPNVKDSSSPTASVSDSDKSVAQQFNQAVRQFFSDTVNSEDKVSGATNYYISKMVKLKNDDPGTRSSAIIPVSLNFSTDGITGLNMGQGFTISDQLIPYSYQVNKYGLNPVDELTKVGFIVTGLDHSIESNRWKTNVRANMFYLKKQTDYDFNKLADTLSQNRIFNDTVEVGAPKYEGVKSPPTQDQKSSLESRGWVNQVDFTRTIIDPKIEKPKLIAKYGETMARAILAVMQLEQGNKGFNWNLGGFDLENSSDYRFNPNIHVGYVMAKEGGTGKMKPFAAFKNFESFLTEIEGKFRRRGFQNGNTADKFALLYYEKWNGFGARDLWKFGVDSQALKKKYPTLQEYDAYKLEQFAATWSKI